MTRSRTVSATRRLHCTLAGVMTLLALVSACGGGGDPPTGTNNNGNNGNNGNGNGNNPPVIGPPVSIVLESGDAQSAEPGITLSSPIAIIVRDSGSRAVPSAAVSIVVDSGGGTLSATTATTGTDGRATLPAWTLGTVEGPQVLRVTSGAAVAKARANARIAATTLPSQNAPAAGGTITVHQAGSVLNGLSIVIPSGGYSTQQSVALSYASSSSITAPAGGTVASPLITVGGLQNLATKDMTITIPAKVPAGQTPVVVIKDPGSNATSTLRLVSWTPTSVTASFRSLNGANVADIKTQAPVIPENLTAPSLATSFAKTHALFGSAIQENGPAQVYTVTIPDAEIFKTRNSLFRVSEDAWNFAAMPTTLDAFTQRGMAATALNFFMNIKPLAGSLKSNKYFGPTLSYHIPYANRRAMRLVSMASLQDAVFGFGQVVPQTPSTDADWRSIAATMLLAGDMPIPMWVVTPDLSMVRAVLVYSIGDNGVMLAYDPLEAPGTSAGLVFDKATHLFLGYTPTIGAALQTNVRLIPSSAYAFFDKSVVSSLTLSVASSTFGDDKFKKAIVRSAFDSITKVGDTTYVLDTLSMWSHCGGCAEGEPATFNPTPVPPRGEVLPSWFWASKTLTGELTPISGNALADRRGGFRLNAAAFPELFIGLFIQTGTCGTADKYTCWVDAVAGTPFYKAFAQIIAPPAKDTIKPGKAATFGDDLHLVPRDAESEWDFGDETARKNEGTSRVTTHAWEKPGDYWVKVRVIHKRSKQIIAIDSLKIKVQGCAETFVDPRDGAVYKQVCIDKQVWMAENLRFADPGSVCYDRVDSNCATWGRLYLWKTLLKGAAFNNKIPSGVRGVCPADWHVPSIAEWEIVIDKYGGRTQAGFAFMSTNLWTNFSGGVGTNASGLNIIPAGFFRSVDNRFLLMGQYAMLASSSDTFYSSVPNMEVINPVGNRALTRLAAAFNDEYLSVRCVRDAGVQ